MNKWKWENLEMIGSKMMDGRGNLLPCYLGYGFMDAIYEGVLLKVNKQDITRCRKERASQRTSTIQTKGGNI